MVQETEIYPMYKERFPIQLLNFIRFSRIQDIGELAKVQFDSDVIISPQNEYEVLQLVMADLRERLQGYRENQVCPRRPPLADLTWLAPMHSLATREQSRKSMCGCSGSTVVWESPGSADADAVLLQAPPGCSCRPCVHAAVSPCSVDGCTLSIRAAACSIVTLLLPHAAYLCDCVGLGNVSCTSVPRGCLWCVQEEDLKMLQNPDMPPLERLAALTRRSEKDILLSTTDAVRQRLAPIRGIPTKSGKLEDPNQDLIEIFESIEGLGSAPQNIWKSFSRWASGKDDPDFKR